MRRWATTIGTLATLAAAPAAAATPVAYRLSPVVEQGALSALSVELSFQGDADGETRLELPDRWAEGQGMWRLISGLSAEGAHLDPGGEAMRILRHAPAAHVTVRYWIGRVGETDPDRSHPKGEPIVRPTWFMAHGEGLFAVPEGRSGAPATFAWGARPAGWRVVSDLDHLAGRTGRVTDIVDSVVLGGTDLTVAEREVDGAPLRVAVAGRWPFTAEEVADRVARIMTVANGLWRDGGRPFVITVTPLAGGIGGSFSTHGTGKGDGFTIESTTNVDPTANSHFLAHEYLHTWIPRELGGLPARDEARDYWFSEGFTDFYASRLLLRAGLWSLEEYAASYSSVLARYDASPARNLTADQVAARFWADQDATQSPYDRGRLLAARWGQAIRDGAQGDLSLDDLLRALRDQARRSPDGPPAAARFLAIAAGLSVGGFDAVAEHDRHVVRGETVDLPADVFGGCLTVRTLTVPIFDRGFDGVASAGTGVITGVDPAGPAFAAGLRDGMRRISREGGKEGDSRVEIGYRVAGPDGVERVVRYRPEGRATTTLREAAVTEGLTAAGRAACVKALGG